jgi:hypothetical protein
VLPVRNQGLVAGALHSLEARVRRQLGELALKGCQQLWEASTKTSPAVNSG